jgi:DNA primase
MAKVSPVAAKYIIHSTIEIDGVVDKPDVIGAIFGQTEGLLGSELELRELQRSGRIGRIEVNLETRMGKSNGMIMIPSSLDKAETCIVGASLEVIQRIGPCNAKIKIQSIEDVRVSKRKYIITRAKDLLKNLINKVLPDSQELTDEVAYAVRVMEVQEYGKERLAAGPTIDESDEVIVVEGRADVLNMLKHGIKNVIAMNGSSVPQTIVELSKKKVITIFVDGDRGGLLDLKGVLMLADVDYVCRAPMGKEVEELTKKELHLSLRAKISAEQAKLEYFQNDNDIIEHSYSSESKNNNDDDDRKKQNNKDNNKNNKRKQDQKSQYYRDSKKEPEVNEELKETFRDMLENLIGTKGAYLIDDKFNILAKVPFSELNLTLENLESGVFAIIVDGTITKKITLLAEKAKINYLVGMDSEKKIDSRIKILTVDDM